MKRVLISAAAVIAGFAFVASGAASAGGGQRTMGVDSPVSPVNVTYSVFSPDGDAATIADGLTGELFTDLGADVTGLCTPATTTLPQDSLTINCSVPSDASYQIGVSGVPDGFYVEQVFCVVSEIPETEAIDDPSASFTIAAGQSASCNVQIAPIPTLWIDKVVSGGTADQSDFTIEIYDETGTLVATAADPSADQCSVDLDDTTCAAVQLEPGDYTLGEEFVSGYEPVQVVCEPSGSILREIFDSELGDFTHSTEGEDTLCTVTNLYVTQVVSADLVVVNDSGGTATGADFTIEIYDNGGNLVDSGVDPEPGTGNASAEFTLPIGDYTFGVSGPAGYTATVEVTVELVPTEIIDDPTAQFTLGLDQTASGVITMDDPTTTTSTTSTTTTTTTVTPTTTLAPTTTVQDILPPTGDDQTSALALLAVGLLLFGSGAMYLARRR